RFEPCWAHKQLGIFSEKTGIGGRGGPRVSAWGGDEWPQLGPKSEGPDTCRAVPPRRFSLCPSGDDSAFVGRPLTEHERHLAIKDGRRRDERPEGQAITAEDYRSAP